MITTPDNDNKYDGPMVFIIIGKGYETDGSEGTDLHVMLKAPDDDTAVREALERACRGRFYRSRPRPDRHD